MSKDSSKKSKKDQDRRSRKREGGVSSAIGCSEARQGGDAVHAAMVKDGAATVARGTAAGDGGRCERCGRCEKIPPPSVGYCSPSLSLTCDVGVVVVAGVHIPS